MCSLNTDMNWFLLVLFERATVWHWSYRMWGLHGRGRALQSDKSHSAGGDSLPAAQVNWVQFISGASGLCWKAETARWIHPVYFSQHLIVWLLFCWRTFSCHLNIYLLNFYFPNDMNILIVCVQKMTHHLGAIWTSCFPQKYNGISKELHLKFNIIFIVFFHLTGCEHQVLT